MEQEKIDETFDFESTTHLDGRFFRYDATKSTNQDVVGICQYCPGGKAIKGKRNSSSNFDSHLKRKHKDVYSNDYLAYVAEKRKKIRLSSQALRQVGKQATCSFSQSLFERNVTEFILHSMLPFSTVEMPSFRKIFDDLKITRNGIPLKHMSRRQLVRHLHIVHKKEMADVQRELARVEYVCTTADVWASSSRRFLAVTAHWMDPQNYKRMSAAIACRRIAGSHTTDIIAELLDNIHEEFQIKEKLVAIVTDNASNFAKAFSELGIDEDALVPYETVVTETVEEGGASDAASDAGSTSSDVVETEADIEETQFSQPDPWEIIGEIIPAPSPNLPRHLPCISHTLNLIATTDFMELLGLDNTLKVQHQRTMGRCSVLWKLLRSPKRKGTLVGILGRALVRPVVVRWNTLYNSLAEIVELKEKICQASVSMGIFDPLQERDFIYIEEYLRCFKPIADAMLNLQAENLAYYGSVLPTIVTLQRLMAQLENGTCFEFCQSLPGHIRSCIDKRFAEYLDIRDNGEFAAISTVLHPRFKTIWMPSFSTERKSLVSSAVKSAINLFYERTESSPVKEDIYFDEIFDFGNEEPVPSYPSPLSGISVPEIELRNYLTKQPTYQLGSLNSYPTLKKAFLYFNTPPPSSAAVERLFSYATMINVPKYNRLTDVQFEMRVLTKCNSVINKT